MSKHFWWILILISLIKAETIKVNNDTLNFLQNIKEKSFKVAAKYNGNSKLFQRSIEIKRFPTVFYFYTSSMGLLQLKSFIQSAKQIKNKYPNFTFYVVFKGFIPNKFLIEVRKKLYNSNVKGVFSFKVHPYLYKYYNLDSVPAYVYTECPKDFRMNQCLLKNSYLVRGDFKLTYFFELLANSDDKFKKYNIFQELK